MRSDPRVLLEDIDQAGSDLEHFVENMDSAAYVADVQTQAAVERKFEIIGEAMNQLHQILFCMLLGFGKRKGAISGCPPTAIR